MELRDSNFRTRRAEFFTKHDPNYEKYNYFDISNASQHEIRLEVVGEYLESRPNWLARLETNTEPFNVETKRFIKRVFATQVGYHWFKEKRRNDWQAYRCRKSNTGRGVLCPRNVVRLIAPKPLLTQPSATSQYTESSIEDIQQPEPPMNPEAVQEHIFTNPKLCLDYVLEPKPVIPATTPSRVSEIQ